MHLLAYAERTDLVGPDWTPILWGLLVVAAVAVLALLPLVLAWGHRHVQVATGAALVWALVAASSELNTLIIQPKWAAEWNARIMSGYLDPADTTGAPPWLWPFWGNLAGIYLLLLVCLLATRRRPPANG